MQASVPRFLSGSLSAASGDVHEWSTWDSPGTQTWDVSILTWCLIAGVNGWPSAF